MMPTTNDRGAVQARGLGAPTGRIRVRSARRRLRPCASGDPQSLRSGAQALRKYACDANAINLGRDFSTRSFLWRVLC
eukprot:6182614-Pleurochrysis_carterae.AAC.1